ncbi:MAG TPA: Asp-tRNA(Asn)/Glu-tRNA(Gln) amidotransferase GatCAB subunit A, partial [Anaeromyxobacteraceae bacterium]|nr:Asp-tRNA(Asn)/Glu-tRNA(Gln) amidotransferase GatCAB subunit A [Anaeromyxobacteraceae bacterium]
MSALLDLSIAELSGKLASREVSSREVAEAALARVAATDETLGAFLPVTAGPALAAARASDE